MSELIRVHVFVAKTELTAETLQDVYGMADVTDRSILGLVSGALSQESIDSLRSLNVDVFVDQERGLPDHSVQPFVTQPFVTQDNVVVRIFKRARSWLRVMLDDVDDGYQ
jgi:hypothetical protein